MIPVILFSGYSNAGKTTVIQSVISDLTDRGYSIATVKHHKGDFDLGEEKDGTKHMRAGAKRVILSSDTQVVDIVKLDSERSLTSILKGIRDVDLVVVEGYKSTVYPKIEVYRRELGHKRIGKNRNIVGLVSDEKIEEFMPNFQFDEMGKLADFIENSFLRGKSEEVASC